MGLHFHYNEAMYLKYSEAGDSVHLFRSVSALDVTASGSGSLEHLSRFIIFADYQ